MDQEEAKRWHACADNSDVDLDGRPDRDVSLVESGICRAAKVDEKLKADYANNSDARIRSALELSGKLDWIY